MLSRVVNSDGIGWCSLALFFLLARLGNRTRAKKMRHLSESKPGLKIEIIPFSASDLGREVRTCYIVISSSNREMALYLFVE
jgi:hypothetical protein